jgi:hypothetical protein
VLLFSRNKNTKKNISLYRSVFISLLCNSKYFYKLNYLTMKEQRNFSRSVIAVVLVTVLLLMVPLVAMQFTNEVDWSAGDFIVMGLLLFGTGFSYVLITRSMASLVTRAAAALGIGTILLLIWANLAVGLIGGGPNAGNLMYIGIIAVVIVGTILSRFTARGMERTMFAAAIALVVHTGIALAAGMHNYPGSSVNEIICVNTFFATLFAVSGLLFRYGALKHAAGEAASQ